MFVITTDGMENASRKYSYEKVRQMIEARKETGWEFLFLGANIDAAREAARFGISEDCAADYHCDPQGTQLNFEAISDAVCDARAARPIHAGWKRKITEDFKKRSK